MKTVRLTAAEATFRYLAAQLNEEGVPFLAGCWAIFGHGNVSGIGEALYAIGDEFPTWRGHNEQGMANAAIAYTKALNRKRAMAITTSIGPGAPNLVTSCALAHVNRLPVLLLPGDVFANRTPDPVLQQLEDFNDGTMTVNDVFKPISRYFDRIMRPEQLLSALPRDFATMTDPADCGPVTLAFCQDVQAEAYDWPADFFAPKEWHRRRPRPGLREVKVAADAIRSARRPLIIAGGGVLYAEATGTLKAFAEKHNIPVGETQAGKSSMPWDHPLNLGSIGVTGSAATNAIAADADVIVGVGTRLQDFTTGSWSLFQGENRRIVSINVTPFDTHKHSALPLVADALLALDELSQLLGEHRAPDVDASLKADWIAAVDKVTAAPAGNELPTDMQVVGAVQRSLPDDAGDQRFAERARVVAALGGAVEDDLQEVWRAHVEGRAELLDRGQLVGGVAGTGRELGDRAPPRAGAGQLPAGRSSPPPPARRRRARSRRSPRRSAVTSPSVEKTPQGRFASGEVGCGVVGARNPAPRRHHLIPGVPSNFFSRSLQTSM